MKALFLCLVFALPVGVHAQSNPPNPTPPKAAEKPKSDATKDEGKANSSKRVTSGLPLSIVISKAPVIQVETTDKTKKTHDYFGGEWWLVYLTGVLATVTAGLAIYTAKLYSATVKLGEEAETTSKRQATEMRDSLELSRVSLALAREEFIAAHRPWVSVEVDLASGIEREEHGYTFTLHFTLKNTGESLALIVRICPEITTHSDLITAQRIVADRAKAEKMREGVGDIIFNGETKQHMVSLTMGNSVVSENDAWNAEHSPQGPKLPVFAIVGCIDYQSPMGQAHHQTGFILNLTRFDSTRPNQRFMIPQFDVGKKFNLVDLRLEPFFFASGYAN